MGEEGVERLGIVEHAYINSSQYPAQSDRRGVTKTYTRSRGTPPSPNRGTLG